MFTLDKIRVGSERVYTDEGFLCVPARISRTGIQEYLAKEIDHPEASVNPTKRIAVYRPPEEVFKPESMASFQDKIITNNHPKESVSSENARQLSVGHSGHEVTRDGDYFRYR